MKNFKSISILLCFLCGEITAQKIQKSIKITPAENISTEEIVEPTTLFTISGKVTQTFTYSYHGGIAPRQETIDQIRKENEEGAIPRPFPEKKFYIRKGDTNTVKSPILLMFTTGEQGKFSFQLANGVYAIILPEQVTELYGKDFQDIDIKCLNAWWVKPYYILDVKGKDISDLDFNFQYFFGEGLTPCPSQRILPEIPGKRK